MKNGEHYTGIFSGANLDSADPHYVLKMVKRSQNASSGSNGTTTPSDEYLGIGEDHLLTFPISDVIDMNVSDVVLEKSTQKAQNGEFG